MATKTYLNALSDSALQPLQLLGRNLKQARERRGLSLSDAAHRCQMARSTYQGLEKGDARTSIGAYLCALHEFGMADALGDLAAPHRDEEAWHLENQGSHSKRRRRR